MVYLIYGLNLNRVNFLLDKIKFTKDYERITLTEPVGKDLIVENLYTPPMLFHQRLVILENLTNFEKFEFSKIDPKVDVVILQRKKTPKLPPISNLTVFEAKSQPRIFKFLDRLIFLPKNLAIAETFQILKIEEPNFVFHQIISHVRRLILIKNLNSNFDIRENLADWQIRKYQQIASNLTFAQLVLAFKLLLLTEIEVKTGQKQLLTQLPLLVLKLTQIFKKP